MRPIVDQKILDQLVDSLVREAGRGTRAANAIERGARFITEGRCQVIGDDSIRVESDSGNTYITSLTDCAEEDGATCPAFENGFPCKHRAALHLLILAKGVERDREDAERAKESEATRAALREQERLWEIIKDQRQIIQRLQFPKIYPPNCPIGEEEIAQEIYEVAAHIKALMEREGMQENYEVTYNCMVEIASFGTRLCHTPTV
jgi:hypothetical protein